MGSEGSVTVAECLRRPKCTCAAQLAAHLLHFSSTSFVVATACKPHGHRAGLQQSARMWRQQQSSLVFALCCAFFHRIGYPIWVTLTRKVLDQIITAQPAE